MLEGFSSVVFCLGSPNSGKTYSLAGKTIHLYEIEAEPGIIIYMMRRLFSKFKHEVSLYSTYSFWCKFMFVERDRVRNLYDELMEQGCDSTQISKILIKSYSHFEELISKVYSKSNNKCHIIIELILQKDTPNQQPTTSSVRSPISRSPSSSSAHFSITVLIERQSSFLSKMILKPLYLPSKIFPKQNRPTPTFLTPLC